MKKLSGVIACIIVLATIAYMINRKPVITVDKAEDFQVNSDIFRENMVSRMNSDETKISLGGYDAKEYGFDFYVSDEFNLMVEDDFLKSLMSCSVME